MQLTGRAWGGQSNNEMKWPLRYKTCSGKQAYPCSTDNHDHENTSISDHFYTYVAVMRWRFTSVSCMSFMQSTTEAKEKLGLDATLLNIINMSFHENRIIELRE